MTNKHWQVFVALILTAGLGGVALLPFARCSFDSPSAANLNRFEFAQPHMGTLCRIVLYARDGTTAKQASEAAFARIAELDGIMSDYKEDSELMRLCKQAGGPAVRVSDDLFRVLQAAQELAIKSDGAFDVTCGPVVRLWRRARRQRELPDERRLAEAKTLCGYQKLVLDAKDKTVRLMKSGMAIDLGGIAKGDAADEALAVLKKRGVESALVACGGDIAVSAAPPGAEGWTIGIAGFKTMTANMKVEPALKELILANAAVSTSGDAEQFVEIAGTRYSHILDPRTGRALTGQMAVTVVARKGIDSDRLTKVVSVLGPKEGMPIIESIDGAAALVVRLTDGSLSRFESKNWNRVRQK